MRRTFWTWNESDLALLISGIITILLCSFLINPLIEGPISENIIIIVPVLLVVLIVLIIFTTLSRKLLGNKNKNVGKGYFVFSFVLLALFITIMNTVIL